MHHEFSHWLNIIMKVHQWKMLCSRREKSETRQDRETAVDKSTGK